MAHVLVTAIVLGALGPLVIDLWREGRAWTAAAGMAFGLLLVLIALNHVGGSFGLDELGVWAGAAVVLCLGVWGSLVAPPGPQSWT